MTTATRYNIIPYFSRVRCSNCEHVYTPRSRNPLVCPKCRHPFLAIIFDKLEELRANVIQTSKN